MDGKDPGGEINGQRKDVPEVPSLDKFLVKHVSRLEKEAPEQTWRKLLLQVVRAWTKVLVKRVSRLEKEKMSSSLNQEDMNLKRIGRKDLTQSNEGGLDQILVKQKSRLEREKMVSAQQSGEEVPARLSVSRREAREREMQAAWGGLSLGNSIRPHLSKLEKEKAAWIKAEEEARRQATGV
ncbi:hypothetical protein OIU78_008413 [Salix suchowensis]|nr:hypothetical protein OIU78_008413 [Salix suchowensis]